MNRSSDRILTSHVGSLIRPPALIEFLRRIEAGASDAQTAFEECLKQSVADVVARQAQVGLDIINDGEYGKNVSWSRYVLERMSGFVRTEAPSGDVRMPSAIHGRDRREFAEFYREYDGTQGFTRMRGWAVTGPIRYIGQAAIQRDIEDLRLAARGIPSSELFMTAVAPASVLPERQDQYYESDAEFLFAVADALNEEYRQIIEAGFVLQIDDAYLATYYNVMVPPGTLEDYRRWAELRVEALNRALRDIPEDRTRYHVCWGSWNGPHVSDVALADIIDLILRVRTGGYAIEMANPRHEHEWRIWQRVKLPAQKVLLPGVISHSTNVVEHPELVAERITRLAALVGRESLIASTDCGFAQGPFVRRVHPSIMWAKLAALVEGARIASRTLWGR